MPKASTSDTRQKICKLCAELSPPSNPGPGDGPPTPGWMPRDLQDFAAKMQEAFNLVLDRIDELEVERTKQPLDPQRDVSLEQVGLQLQDIAANLLRHRQQ